MKNNALWLLGLMVVAYACYLVWEGGRWERDFARARNVYIATGRLDKAKSIVRRLLPAAAQNQKPRAELLHRQIQILEGPDQYAVSPDVDLIIHGGRVWRTVVERVVLVSVVNSGKEPIIVRGADFFARAKGSLGCSNTECDVGIEPTRLKPRHVLNGAVVFSKPPVSPRESMEILYVGPTRFARAYVGPGLDRFLGGPEGRLRVRAADTADVLPQARQPAALGERFEREQSWTQAIEQYERSLQALDTPEVRARVAALKQLLRGLALEAQEDWAGAAEAYRQAAACSNREFVEARRACVKQMPLYLAAMEKARALEESEDEQAALAAYDEARNHAAAGGIKSDVEAKMHFLRTDMRRRRERRWRRMAQVLLALKDNKLPHAMLFACDFYEQGPGYRAFADAIAASRQAAEQMRAEPEPFKAIELDCVVLNNGDEHLGEVLSRSGDTLAMKVRRGIQAQTLAFTAEEIKSVTKKQVSAQQVKEWAARDLFADVLRQLRARREAAAADLIARLASEFADTEFIKDTDEQAKLSDAIASEQATRVGRTLEEMTRNIVPLVEECADFDVHRCKRCKGKGWVACPDCRGARQPNAACPRCRGAKKIPCDECAGAGRFPAKEDLPSKPTVAELGAAPPE